MVQDGRHARLSPGDFALYDSTRPYELHFDGPFQQYVLKLPGPTLRTALRDTHRLTATAVSGARGAGHLMIGMIRTLAADIETLAPESAVAVADSVTQILIAGLSALPAAHQPALSNLTALHREQIKACVRARLREPGLSVARHRGATAAVAEHAAPRVGGRAVLAGRLDLGAAARRGAARPLRPGACRRAASARSAFSWGFNDAAHFSRAFRARFGCSPRALRAVGGPRRIARLRRRARRTDGSAHAPKAPGWPVRAARAPARGRVNPG